MQNTFLFKIKSCIKSKKEKVKMLKILQEHFIQLQEVTRQW